MSISSTEAVERVRRFDWNKVSQDLNEHGNAVLPALLSPDESRAVASLYPDDAMFRSRVVMSRHGFGRGEYKYFNYPLPGLAEGLRTELYAKLAPVANEWNAAMGIPTSYPEAHEDFVKRCHEAGQQRPTPLLLQYGAGDFNCLHQDLYGEHVFPIQVAILLSEPKRDFEGGSLSLRNRGRGCNLGRKWSRFARATQ